MSPLSREFLLQQGKCCGNKCQNCPYVPKHVAGSTEVTNEPTVAVVHAVVTAVCPAAVCARTAGPLEPLEKTTGDSSAERTGVPSLRSGS